MRFSDEYTVSINDSSPSWFVLKIVEEEPVEIERG